MTHQFSLTVHTDRPNAEISPLLHGHFAEHLGELIYPGVWVGPDSQVPHTGGIRNDIVDALKPLEIPVLRWPGGCFADTYHWRDGIGPVESRPKRINVHWGMQPEPNHFGTHEFVALCRALGAEPYFAANLGSGTPGEMSDWIEYCNFGGNSALADERRSNGHVDPFGIKYWGIGNENWGCGGDMTPQQYAGEFSRYASYARAYPGAPIEKIACGPNANDWNWTREFFKSVVGRHNVHAFGAHYYCWTAGTATVYTDRQWLELLSRASAVEGIIVGHRSIMDEYDPERKVKLLLDEWGSWHPVEEGKPSGGLYQQSTIRDGLVAALSLDTFHNHTDKLGMANIAQLINVLQALLLVKDDQVVKTPTYHVFDLYKPHKGGVNVQTSFSSDIISDGEGSSKDCRNCYLDKQFPGLRRLSGSASIKDGVLCITVTNSHPTEECDLKIGLNGATWNSVEVRTLSADDIHAHNTFEHPERVTLSEPLSISLSDAEPVFVLPAASVTRIIGRLQS